MFDYEIQLQRKIIIQDEFLQEKIEFESITVLAQKKEVGRFEFYQSHSNKLKISCIFVINAIEYDQHYTHILFEEKQYKILKTYQNGQLMELTCE